MHCTVLYCRLRAAFEIAHRRLPVLPTDASSRFMIARSTWSRSGSMQTHSNRLLSTRRGTTMDVDDVDDHGGGGGVALRPERRMSESPNASILQDRHENSDKSSKAKTAAKDSANGKLSPMLRQYFQIKEQHPDYILLFRVGDFYEALFDDAKTMSAALDITLTARGKHSGQPIPMCGVPHHAIDSYLFRLVKKGILVAVCDQMEDPAVAKRERRPIVQREVTRLVTPGTITEDSFLDAREHNYLAAIISHQVTSGTNPAEHMLGLAWLDMSTGEFRASQISLENVQSELLKLQPSEVLVSQELATRNSYIRKALLDYHVTIRPQEKFAVETSVELVRKYFAKDGKAAQDGGSSLSLLEATASGVLIDYVLETQKGKMPHLDRPSRVDIGKTMRIDIATRKSLEIDRTLSGQRKGSLLHVMDQTVTGPGSRLLQTYLRSPLTDLAEINSRLDCVEYFYNDLKKSEEVRQLLRSTADMERCLQRISVQRGGPRDLECIANTLLVAVDLADMIISGSTAREMIPMQLRELIYALHGQGAAAAAAAEIKRAIRDGPPISASDGGFIKPGYSQQLDDLIALRDHSSRLISELQTRYREMTGVNSLKIRNTGNHGYFVEVPTTQQAKMAKHHTVFHQMQTMTNNVRYRTEELGSLQDRLGKVHAEALRVEMDIFEKVSRQVLHAADEISGAARAIAAIDVFTALATLARRNQYTRPVLHAPSRSRSVFSVESGRHPIVEYHHQAANGGAVTSFVANDCHIDTDKKGLLLITGPNMSGKSVFLRQNALIILMAQTGSFVPADSAELTVADALFSRVGASDNVANDQSTFMVEMMETANILNQATCNSFVIVDEIGRGTANFDGLSIAWAVLEHMHNVTKCRALFSTHYHELVDLEHQLEKMACYCLNVRDVRGDIVFTHKIVPGSADQSYGIHVAEMAGVPKTVTERASQILKLLGKQRPDLRAITECADATMRSDSQKE